MTANSYSEGILLKFDPFYFKNGRPSKPKYFIVLKSISNTLVMASLPTSKDHIPSDVTLSQGCVNDTERNVSSYVLEAGHQVTESFSFPRNTFIYAEQVDEYDISYLGNMNSNIFNLGKIIPELFNSIIECLKNSKTLKRKYRRYL